MILNYTIKNKRKKEWKNRKKIVLINILFVKIKPDEYYFLI